MMKRNEKILMTVAPAIVRLGIKALRYSKDGYTKDEARELGSDLLLLALTVIDLAQEE
jgi:hypothetical protein